MSGGKVLNISQQFWEKLEARGDRKDTQGAHCLFIEMSNLKAQLEFSEKILVSFKEHFSKKMKQLLLFSFWSFNHLLYNVTLLKVPDSFCFLLLT